LEALRSDLGLPLDQVAEKLGISRATLHRRKASGRLNLDESDRVLRFARLLKQAAEVFGGTDRARLWLSFPQWGLGGAVPLDYARTEIGAREVEKLLHRVEHSVYV
jgi:putative toxin-antitoxin system antitoxin component (TIGR02293 family)